MVSTPVGILYKVAYSQLSTVTRLFTAFMQALPLKRKNQICCNDSNTNLIMVWAVTTYYYLRLTCATYKVVNCKVMYDLVCSSAARAIFEQLQAAPQNDST